MNFPAILQTNYKNSISKKFSHFDEQEPLLE